MHTNYTVRHFAPERWGEVDKFATFYTSSFPRSSKLSRRALSGVINHFRKAITLRSLAERLKPLIQLDRQELHQKGYTPARNSYDIAAIVECIFTELYSTVDCTCQVVEAMHDLRGVPKSTRRLFQRINAKKLDDVLPAELLEAYKSATWYEQLRSMRDELTHSDLGSCHFDDAAEKLSYWHSSLGHEGKSLIIKDIYGRLDNDINNVNVFLGQIFRYMNTLLVDIPVVQVCGLTQGKALLRELRPENFITFDSGICKSTAWVEVDGKPTCPLLCGAYHRAISIKTSEQS